MLSVVMLNVVMLNVLMLRVIMLTVIASLNSSPMSVCTRVSLILFTNVRLEWKRLIVTNTLAYYCTALITQF
jgi:hypothetical protein